MLDFGMMKKGDKEGVQMARIRAEWHSLVLAAKDGQLRLLPSPCLYLLFLPMEQQETCSYGSYPKILGGLHFLGLGF